MAESEEKIRKIGVASGMVHALVMLKREIGWRVYHPLPAHHTAKIREREMQVSPLRELYRRLKADLRSLQAAIDEQP